MRTIEGSPAGIGFLSPNRLAVSDFLIIGLALLGVLVVMALIGLRAGRRDGIDPLAGTGTATASAVSTSASAIGAGRGTDSGGRGPGSSVTAGGRTWQVLAVYTYEEDGERWEERRLRAGAVEAWLSEDEHGSPLLFDRRWQDADFPTRASATMPDGSSAERIESGTARFTAVGEHDGWGSGQLSYATFRGSDGTQWSFELHDGGEVEAWSGTSTTVVDA